MGGVPVSLRAEQRTDVRVVELYGRDTRHRVLAEFRDVSRDEAVLLVRSIIGYPPRPIRWVQPAAQCRVDGKWSWVGPQTAKQMGVFPKGAVV